MTEGCVPEGAIGIGGDPPRLGAVNGDALKIACERGGMRFDAWLAASVPGMTRARAQALIEAGCAKVNGVAAEKSYKMSPGDAAEVLIPPPAMLDARPEDISLDVVYEDASIVVVNKPQGMVVHPACGHWDGTLVNALLFHCQGGLSDINGVIRPGIVHRLDKLTSGLVVAAKTNAAHIALSAAFKERNVSKAYAAVVVGHVAPDCGRIEYAIGRNPNDRKKMAAFEVGATAAATATAASAAEETACKPARAAPRAAVSEFRVVSRLDGRHGRLTLLDVDILTGRTHQIRVHLAAIGHPVAGDVQYGGERARLRGLAGEGHMLHASRLGFIHPESGERMEFSAPLPPRFTALLEYG